MTWICLLLLACAPDADEAEPTPPVGANIYLEQMWAQRALTVRAGLDEARELYGSGERERAREMVLAVYEGSFEPELEPLVREVVDPRKAAELEYRFGLVRRAMSRRRNSDGVAASIEALCEQLDRAAGELDRAQAVIEG